VARVRREIGIDAPREGGDGKTRRGIERFSPGQERKRRAARA